MFLVSIKESYHVLTMASYYIVGGVVVTHTLYNLHSISLRKSVACVRILTLGQHSLYLVIQSRSSYRLGVCTQCSCIWTATMGPSSYFKNETAHCAKGSGQS